MDKPFIRQLWVVSAVLLIMIELGMFHGFLTCLMPALEDPKSSIKGNLEEISWIGASMSISCIPGAFVSSFYMDRFGRKIAFILGITPGAIGLLLIYFATDIYTLIAARILQGLTVATASLLGAIVIGEYTSPSHRGMFLNMKTAAFYVGSAIIHVLGKFYHWRTLALISLIPYVVNFVMVFTWPESPAWLLKKKKNDEYTKIFYKLRGKNVETTRELNDMIKSQEGNKKQKETSLRKIVIFFRKFGRKNFVKPVIVFVVAIILLETTFKHTYPAYAFQITSQISGEYDPFYLTLGLDILVTISAFFSLALIKMAKRRTLLFSTGTVSCLVLISVCGYLFLVSRGIITNIPWIPMVLFGIYLVVVNLACAPIPLGLVGEIFPLEHRGAGTTIAGVLTSSITIVSNKTLPYLLVSLKIYETFFIFGVIMAISLVFLYFLLPETKDRSLIEIEYFFNHGKFKLVDKKDDEAEARMLPQ